MLWLYQYKTARVLGFCQAGGMSMIHLLANESQLHRIPLLSKYIYLLSPGHQNSQSLVPSLSSVGYCSQDSCNESKEWSALSSPREIKLGLQGVKASTIVPDAPVHVY